MREKEKEKKRINKRSNLKCILLYQIQVKTIHTQISKHQK
jgi:hypothetical protein